MFNPFRKNAKKLDLTPTMWEKIRLRAYMAWVAARVLSSRINTSMVIAVVLIGAVVYGSYRFVKHVDASDRAYRFHWQNDPCSAFANETMNNVPLRCLPNSAR